MIDVTEERKFLHDLASPLAAAIFTLDVVIEQCREQGTPSVSAAEQAEQMERMRQALDKVRHLIQDRRALLIKRSESGST